MVPERVELTTTISNMRDLRASVLEPFDAVYLGNPYCSRYEGNLLERPDELAAAIRIVRDQGRRAYVTTYAAPHARDTDRLRRALDAARSAGVVAAEVHALGMARVLRAEFPELALHAGSFANVYTVGGAQVWKSLGAVRIAPPAELPLDEVALLGRSGVAVEVTVHGKLPLGISDSCLLLGCEAELGVGCPDLCQQDVFLSRGDWTLKSVGTGVLSGRDACLLEHLPRLLTDGHRHFRVEAVSEAPAYRLAVGHVYREALRRILAGDPNLDSAWWEALRSHSRAGFCNGFAFGRSGFDYVGAERSRISLADVASMASVAGTEGEG